MRAHGVQRSAQNAQEVFAGEERQRLLEQAGGVDRLGLPSVGVDPEQGSHGYTQSQMARPVVQVDVGARLELLKRAVGLLDDCVGRCGDVLAVEGGKHDPPGSAVELAIDRQQTVAHQADQVTEVRLAPQ